MRFKRITVAVAAAAAILTGVLVTGATAATSATAGAARPACTSAYSGCNPDW